MQDCKQLSGLLAAIGWSLVMRIVDHPCKNLSPDTDYCAIFFVRGDSPEIGPGTSSLQVGAHLTPLINLWTRGENPDHFAYTIGCVLKTRACA